jgi:DMSO reductase family type II enzyme chaperone
MYNITESQERDMAESEVVSVTEAGPLVRSSIYRMLAQGFKYPTKEMFESYLNGEFVTDLIEHISSVPHLSSIVIEEANLSDRVKQGLAGVSFEDFEVNYVHTFDVGFPQPPCPPYEGLYRQGEERTAIMVEISEFYKHFGLSMSREEGKRELPDYLCAELEFLHFLTVKEAQARENGDTQHLRGYIHAQKDFLERHMIDWFPKFCQKLEKSDAQPFFKDLGRIVLRFTAQEFGFVSKTLKSFDN